MIRILWTQKQDEGPSPRGLAAMAYDSVRGRSVLFGGSGSELVGTAVLGDTWEWDGANWTQVADSGPPARNFACAAYDAERRQTVIFGGATGPTTWLGDTWGWDGSNWTQLADSGPSTRYGSAMAFDTGAQHIVLYGGSGGGAVLFADTWEWDGAAWTQVAETGPPARAFHAMAYDNNRKRTVLFGGRGAGANATTFGDTWEWDGAVWTEISSFGAPPCAFHAMAFKADSVALFNNSATWTWDGRHWTLRQDFGPSPHRTGHAMCYDSKRASLAVFGGTQTDGETLYGDTWEHSEG